MYQQIELPDRTWLAVGDRRIIHPGLPSQRCGVVIEFRQMSHADGWFPVVLWDSGFKSFASYEWGLRRLEVVEQLSLF